MGWAQKIMVVLHFIEVIFLLNILWIMGAIAGLGVFGIFPSTRAVFLLINNGILKKEDESSFKEISKDFYRKYRTDFLMINKFALIYIPIYLILMFDFNATALMPTQIKVFALTLLIVLLVYVFLTNVYLLMDEQIIFGKVLIKKIMVMPMVFPIASIVFFVFVATLTLLTIRFSFIFVACYFSIIILIQVYFLNENIKKRIAPSNE
ncbi:YesL family protein [Lapidilactobacillus wuchangensis]|uniref:YesL family protein n=1 Tax=Lapidilactobacillus wuchangensis TaxID=2486001 RepID=UPI000F783449|nr:YesL family protein [Lapidilactobacillus wuchangensis]